MEKGTKTHHSNMITEAYIKGRCDNGIGKCAVVIVEGGVTKYHRAWFVGGSFPFNGKEIIADQYNCEIVAACFVMDWCKRNGVSIVNIYANTQTCQKWYYRRAFPQERELGQTFNDYAKGIDVYADYIPKSKQDKHNIMVNQLAESIR